MKMLLNNHKLAYIIFIPVFLTIGCKKAVEVPAPYTSINSGNVYTTDATAAAVLTALYARLNNGGLLGSNIQSMSFIGGLSSDELSLYNNSGVAVNLINCYKNALNAQSGLTTIDVWASAYQYIYITNAAVEGLNNTNSLTPAVKQQLLGEAKFMRAFFYFYLINLYGDIPLVLSTNYTQNQLLPRTAKAKVYQQIVSDLIDAQILMSGNYLDGTLIKSTTERTRPNKWVATALLSRVYLYTKDYTNAQIQANALISNVALFGLSSLTNAFLKASSGNNEAIWQLQPVVTGQNTQDALLFIIPATGLTTNSTPIYLSKSLLASFEAGDQRKANWVNSVTVSGTTYFYPYKYKLNTTTAVNPTEYTMVLRLAEQYFIRAEAEANGATGGTIAAIADLNVIRNRAGLSNYSGATDKPSVLTAIMHERQIELFTEWGHRWLDLKRTGTVDLVMSTATLQKGGTWDTNQQLYPILQGQIQLDPNLIQNPGY